MPFLVASPSWECTQLAVTNSINCKVFATWGERRVRAKKYGRYADARKNEGQSSLLVYKNKTRAANLSLCVHFFRNLFRCGETLLKVAVPLAERAGRRARVRLQSAGITPILIMIIESQHQQKAAPPSSPPLLCVFLIFRTPAAFIFNFTLKPLSGAINHSRRAKCRSNFKRLAQYLTQTLGNRTLALYDSTNVKSCRMERKKKKKSTTIVKPENWFWMTHPITDAIL